MENVDFESTSVCRAWGIKCHWTPAHGSHRTGR